MPNSDAPYPWTGAGPDPNLTMCGEDHYGNGWACRQRRGHYCTSPDHDLENCDCVCHATLTRKSEAVA